MRTSQKVDADYDPLLLFHTSTEDDARGTEESMSTNCAADNVWGGVKCMETPGSFLLNSSRKAEG